jgi:hypothetical protein
MSDCWTFFVEVKGKAEGIWLEGLGGDGLRVGELGISSSRISFV